MWKGSVALQGEEAAVQAEDSSSREGTAVGCSQPTLIVRGQMLLQKRGPAGTPTASTTITNDTCHPAG